MAKVAPKHCSNRVKLYDLPFRIHQESCSLGLGRKLPGGLASPQKQTRALNASQQLPMITMYCYWCNFPAQTCVGVLTAEAACLGAKHAADSDKH